MDITPLENSAVDNDNNDDEEIEPYNNNLK